MANKTKELFLEIRLQNQIQRRVTEAQFACHLQQLQNAQALLTTCVGNEDKLRIQRMQHEMQDMSSLNRRVEHYAAEQERGKIILEERRSVIQDLRMKLTGFSAWRALSNFSSSVHFFCQSFKQRVKRLTFSFLSWPQNCTVVPPMTRRSNNWSVSSGNQLFIFPL